MEAQGLEGTGFAVSSLSCGALYDITSGCHFMLSSDQSFTSLSRLREECGWALPPLHPSVLKQLEWQRGMVWRDGASTRQLSS